LQQVLRHMPRIRGNAVKRKILLVDDNEDFLDSTRDVLEDEGYEVETASSGEEAIRRVEEAPVDLVVMDIKMPGLNGVESFMQMKRHRPGIPVIMCTAYIVDGLIRQALEEGAYTVLNKPFEMELLLNTITHCLHEQNHGVILLADRDKAFRDRWEEILRRNGHLVTVADNGLAALELAQQRPFDVLVLEMDLPGLDALELHRELQQSGRNVLATVILGKPGEIDGDLFHMVKREPGLISFDKPLDQVAFLELLSNICATNPLERDT
jgi:two-component system, NtrC family, response regulator HydG